MNRLFDLLAALIVAVAWPLMRAADATVCAARRGRIFNRLRDVVARVDAWLCDYGNDDIQGEL